MPAIATVTLTTCYYLLQDLTVTVVSERESTEVELVERVNPKSPNATPQSWWKVRR